MTFLIEKIKSFRILQELVIIGPMDIMAMVLNYPMRFLIKFEGRQRSATLFNVFCCFTLWVEDQARA